MPDVPAHVQRMRDEHKELAERISKLNTFICSNETFATLPASEQRRMHTQLGGMRTYIQALSERIKFAIDED